MIRRWQTLAKDGRIVNRQELGVGVLRLRPAGSTLLYELGYARPPMDVLRLVPTFVRKTYDRLRQMRLWHRGAEPVRTVNVAIDQSNAVEATRTDVAAGLSGVVRATQFATTAFGVGLVLTLVAILVRGTVQTVVQYVATLGFVLAWAAISSGAYQRSATWLRGACLKTVKWWVAIFVPVGLLNLVFTVANAPAQA